MQENEAAEAVNPGNIVPPSPFVFANPNPPVLQGVAGGRDLRIAPPVSEEMYGDNLRRSPFRFANLQFPQGAGQADFPQNPNLPQGAAGGAPIDPFDFHGSNVGTFVPGPRATEVVTNEYYEYLPLSQAISQGDLQAVKSFLNSRPDAVDAWINFFETPLLSACACGQPEIVKELLRRMTPEQMLTPRNHDPRLYHTPLTVVAVNGNLEIAEVLVAKNSKLIEIPGNNGHIPIVTAVGNAQKEMARYLYSKTPLPVLLDYGGFHGTLLLLNAIFYGMLDIALDLFEACPRLAVTKHPLIASVPITCLASRPDLFQTGCDLGFWRSLIYSRVEGKSPTVPETSSNQGQSFLWNILQCLPKWFGIDEVYDLKETHLKAHKLLLGISEAVSTMGRKERSQNGFEEAFFFAVRYGNKEFLVEMIKSNSELLWLAQNSSNSTLFLLAVEFRQEKIFDLFYGLDERRDMLLGDTDNAGNGILHVAGRLSPPDKLSRVAGAALQMQRELQWFKEVESIVPEIAQEKLNSGNLRPREIFQGFHEPLRKEAEEWMKGTATSCSVVAALIVTVTFAAVFTIPGGTDNVSGDPLHLGNARFMVFIVSDMISFFASCTSVLIFLGILTARYSFDDFLVSAPTKMIAGLSILFISIAAMLVAFSTALFTTLYRTSWLVLPVILVAFLPAVLFVLLQYPLLKEMIISTYGRGIFDQKMKRWL